MSARLTSALIVAAGTAIAAIPAAAQTRLAAAKPMMASVDTMLLHGLRYRNVGPPRGGRVTTVTGVPSQPRTFYMGVASGGLFKTTDAGASWIPITDGKVPVASTGSVDVSDSDPNIIYLGTGSDDIRSNVSTGRGVYKSTDAGNTWSFVGLYNAGQIGAVRIHPKNPNVVWVAANGDAFSPSHERGVYKTTDGGKTWKNVLFISDSVGTSDIEINPANPDVVYAWMWRGQRKPWTIISGAPDAQNGSFFKSTDGGEHFKKITNGLPTNLVGKGNLAVTAANPNRVYALVEAKPGGGLYRSDDQGESWKLMNSTAGMIARPFYYTTIGADPTNQDVVYVGAETFYKSTDGGATVRPMPTPHTDNHDIWISPTNGQVMIQSNDGGANVSNDGGRTWSTQMNQPTAEIYGVWMDDQFPYRLYGAQQDASTVIVPSWPLPGQTQPFEDGPGCETGPIMPHPKDPQVVYGACKGQFGRMFMNTHVEQNYWIGSQSLYGNDAKDLILRFQRVSPMETSLFDSSVVYYGSQYVHRSKDGGVHWEKISPDLTANPPGESQLGSGDPITRDVTGEEFYSTLYAISESKLEPGVIWTGSNDGPFHISRDNGKTWKDITPKDLPKGGRVQYIETSPHRKGSAYYAVYRYLLGDYAPYIYKTEDYGATWKRLTDGNNGIPKDWPTRVVREDPDREGLLYAGTEFGMFISFDNGSHWQHFDQNMPTVPITDIKRYHNDLIVATQGRSFYIMDDVTPLTQITPQTASTGVVLFKPRDAIRARIGGGRGGFGGGRGAAAAGQPEFPQYGAMIDYYLASAPSTPVTIEILDANNKTIRTFSSEAAARPVASETVAAVDDEENPGGGRGRGGAPAVRLTTNPGMNRLTWDFNDANGLMLPPGGYKVRLSANGKGDIQGLTLTMDPRLVANHITAADLAAQYAHNVKMREMVTETNKVAGRIRTARTSAEKSNAANLKDVRDLGVTMFGVGEGIRYGQPGLQTQITYLAGETTRVDQRVGQDAIDRAVVLRRELDALEARVNKVLGIQP
jgi:photosystem II stability/assembly factor-like uncharacterized protein